MRGHRIAESRTRRRSSGVLSRFRREESGFGLIELVVASGVMAALLAMMASVLTNGLAATGVARERQTANGLANKVLEEVRALPMATLAKGLDATDLATVSDANIVKNRSSNCTGTGTSSCYNGEVIKTTSNPPGTVVVPLVPHQTTSTIGPTAYTVGTYVTDYNNDATTDGYRVTVNVAWTSAVRGQTSKYVQAQTIIYAADMSGTGCNDATVHPFPGPCQAGFKVDAIEDAASANITGVIGGTTLDHVSINSGRVTSDTSVEQITTVKGVSQAASGELQAAGGTVTSVTGTSAASSADNDPAGTVSNYDYKTYNGAVATGSLAADANGNSIAVNVGAGDSGRTASTTGATSSSYKCPNLTTYPSPYTGDENDGLPCGAAQEIGGGTTTAIAALQTVGSTTLASVAGSTNTSTAITDVTSTPATGRCVATTGDGCARAQVTRTAADLNAGALPANLNAALKPANWATYFARVSAVTDSATAEAGIGTSAPTAAATSGNVTVYCPTIIVGNLLCTGTGYVTKALSLITTPTATGTLTITDPSLGGGTTIAMSATVTPGTTSTTSNCAGTCTRTTSTANSTPTTVTMTYTITVGGTTVLNTTITLNPGTINATATYAAPST